MKKRIKKLLCSSLIAIMSIGCFNAEARVTKEVAEAVLPYLMEAAGIPQDARPNPDPNPDVPYYSQVKRDAIISMIYTDEGQQQMVEWVKNGKFPENLEEARFMSVGTYTDKTYREVSLASLFPCQTGTFTSFANHKSRLGNHILSNTNATGAEKNLKNILSFFEPANSAESIISNINQSYKHLPIDVLLAKTVFILDICDSLQQINKLLGLSIQQCPTTSEYLCRPVSAIVASEGKNYEGDCVETLYRHLLNIAIQDPVSMRKFHTEKLIDTIYRYHSPRYTSGIKNSTDLQSVSEAGLTSVVRHTEWKKCLRETIGEYCSSIGSVNNIARGLSKLASSAMAENDEKTITNALNSLSKNKKFEVKIEGRTEGLPDWVTRTISITEKHNDQPKRIIKIGINEELGAPNEGHAEVLSIIVQ